MAVNSSTITDIVDRIVEIGSVTNAMNTLSGLTPEPLAAMASVTTILSVLPDAANYQPIQVRLESIGAALSVGAMDNQFRIMNSIGMM